MNLRLIRSGHRLLAGLLLMLSWPVFVCHNAGQREGTAVSLNIPILTYLKTVPSESGIGNPIVDFPQVLGPNPL
jgi:hypothetical protein